MKMWKKLAAASVISAVAVLSAGAQKGPQTPATTTRWMFGDIDREILEMAKDFPADKYDFRLKPEMRSFGEVLVHIVGGHVYAVKIAHGEKAKWEEIDPKQFKGKDEIVAMVQKAMDDAEAVLKGLPDETLYKSVQPWASVTEHTAEHYGLLVAYYRANGLVPPESRPKPSK